MRTLKRRSRHRPILYQIPMAKRSRARKAVKKSQSPQKAVSGVGATPPLSKDGLDTDVNAPRRLCPRPGRIAAAANPAVPSPPSMGQKTSEGIERADDEDRNTGNDEQGRKGNAEGDGDVNVDARADADITTKKSLNSAGDNSADSEGSQEEEKGGADSEDSDDNEKGDDVVIFARCC